MLCKVPGRSPFPWLHNEIAKVNTFLTKSFYGSKVTCIDSCPEFGPRYFKKDMIHINREGLQVYGDKMACAVINFQVSQQRRYH